jgi:hypothetical protein
MVKVHTSHLLVVKRDLSRVSREEAERIFWTPSLLGRDGIRGFKLIYSEAEDYVALEDRR